MDHKVWKFSKDEARRLGTAIRRMRLQLGMSQSQFARTVGVRQQKLSEWELGMRLRAVFEAWRLAHVLETHAPSSSGEARGGKRARRNGR